MFDIIFYLFVSLNHILSQYYSITLFVIIWYPNTVWVLLAGHSCLYW